MWVELATVRLQRDDLEAAATTLGEVIGIAHQRPSETVNRRLRQAANLLERPRYQTAGLALDLRDQIRTATTATTLLPAEH